MKLTKFFVSLAAIAIVTEVTRRIVTDNNAHSVWDVWPDDWDEEDDDMYNYQPKKAVKKPPTNAQQRKALLAEQDYWLAQLSDALSTQNETEKAEANENLQRIVDELEAL